MNDATTLSRSSLAALVADLAAAGTRIVAPARAADGGVDYRGIASLDEAVLAGALPRRSLKEYFLPPTEPLLAWKQAGSDVELREVPTKPVPRVVLGARPCDAAAVDVLDKVMGWDYSDELWFGRREATTIVTIACDGGDASCFCTTVGLAPDATRGSDVLLVPAGDGYRAEVVTDKGRAFVAAHASCFVPGDASDTTAFRTAARAKVASNLTADPGKVRAWIDQNFANPLWDEIGLRCHGCGACAAVCPTCHCFDIVDEPDGLGSGVRRRNWDTCQASVFTAHASGHNPRHDQCARCRQRVSHKFAIYPARFADILCTGCGRCARACPGGQDLPEILARISAL